MSFSTILVKGPDEVAFAEWMASSDLMNRIETKHMRATVAPAFTHDIQGVNNPEAAEPKVRELKSKIETLKRMVGNFFLHQGEQIKNANREMFDAMARDLSQRFVSLDRIQNLQIKSAVQELNDFAGYVIRNLRMFRFPAQKNSDEPSHNYTLDTIQTHFKDIIKFIADPNNPFCHFTVVVSPLISEEKKVSFRSEIQHVTKVADKFTLYDGLMTVTKFKECSILTPYYLINGWLVVSTMDLPQPNDIPAPLAFKDGDGAVVFQIVNKVEISLPDAKLREEIKKSIHTWNKIQINKMWAVMLTSLVGAVMFGVVGIITFKPNASFLDKVAGCVVRCVALLLGYLSIAAGVVIYRLHSVYERVMGIDDLGKWVKQVRIFAGNYPFLAYKYPSIQKFLTPNELEWVQTRIENAKSSTKFRKLCLPSFNSSPIPKK